MTDVLVRPERIVDVDGRDPERTPMQWDATPNAGFTGGTPWLPMAADAQKVNVEAQQGDPRSLLSIYRRLTTARRASPALRLGSYRSLSAPRGVFAFVRELDGERVFVALNLTSHERAVTLPFARSRLLLSTHDARGDLSESRTVLSPDEGLIVQEGR